jgi:hypothetical protein
MRCGALASRAPRFLMFLTQTVYSSNRAMVCSTDDLYPRPLSPRRLIPRFWAEES